MYEYLVNGIISDGIKSLIQLKKDKKDITDNLSEDENSQLNNPFLPENLLKLEKRKKEKRTIIFRKLELTFLIL